MHLRISKKLLIYLFIFLLVGTLNNKNISNFKFPKIKKIEISGLSELEKQKLKDDLFKYKNLNLFFLEKKKISEIINSIKIIEKYTITKKYPSNLIIDIKKGNLLAYTKKNNLVYYISSNGNWIKTENNQINLPFIFGNIDIKEFLKFKKIIDKSNFSFEEIKNLYYFKSKRWDIKTKEDLIIKLPIKDIESSFEILALILEKKEFMNFKTIDLRQNNQVIFSE